MGTTASDYTTLTQEGLVSRHPPATLAKFDSSAPTGDPADRAAHRRDDNLRLAGGSKHPRRLRHSDPTMCFPNGPVAFTEPAWRISARRTEEHAPGTRPSALSSYHAQVAVLPTQRCARRPCGIPEPMFSSPSRRRGSPEQWLMERHRCQTSDPRPQYVSSRQGEAVFDRSCAHCHGNPEHPSSIDVVGRIRSGDRVSPSLSRHPYRVSASVSAAFRFRPMSPGSRVRPTSSALFWMYEITLPNGSYPSVDRARIRAACYSSATTLEFQKFDVPNLRGISRDRAVFHQQQREDARRRPSTVSGLFRTELTGFLSA